MSRRPKLDISGINKVDAVPLRQALALQQKAIAEIAKAKERQAALEKEVAEWMENTDPDDANRIQLISGKKIQVDIMPGLIRRHEITLDRELTPTLVREADRFRGNLRRFYEQASEAVAAQVAEVLRPYFSIQQHGNGEKRDRALDMARQADDCFAISMRIERVNSIQISDQPRPSFPEAAARYDSDLAESATALLMLAEEA